MTVSEENMQMDEISLNKIWPKQVINGQGNLYPFSPDRMVKSLNRETGIDWELCIDIVKGTLKRISKINLDKIKTSMVREMICVELIARNLTKERNIFAKLIDRQVVKFTIDDGFIGQFEDQQPPWGPLGYITYKRTYARNLENKNRTEEYFETVRRVVEGVFSIQKEYCFKIGLPWDEEEAQQKAKKMYNLIWKFKFTPPGRGLWMMGTEFIDKHGSMALNNCGFCSTEDIEIKGPLAFRFLMDALMLGVGVGFDTKGSGKITIQKPKDHTFEFIIPDSREGWVQALGHILTAFFKGEEMPVFNYSKIRPAGTQIRGFGGVASGPDPLEQMINDVSALLEKRVGQKITSVDIVDIMNLIGKCVVAGNVRRSAEIGLGTIDDDEYIECKDPDKYQEELYHHRWASNNSIIGYKGMKYDKIIPRIQKNGEPGLLYLENAQKYSRMGRKGDWKDKKVCGVNPCITGDTLIAVADGRNSVTIKQLAEEGKDVLVYCKDDEGKSTVRMMRNPRKTGYVQEIYKIILDDGSHIKCTKNHQFILRDNSIVEAGDLRSGDSLMMMSKWQTTWDEIMNNKQGTKKNAYWMINDGYKNKFEHTLVYETIHSKDIEKGYVIHHRDKNSLNNNIDNLELLDKEAHDEIHDISGDNNPMRKWFGNISEEEQQKYRDKMSEAVSAEKNARYSGQTNEELYNVMLNLIQLNKYPLTVPEWAKFAKKNNLIYNFNEFRGKLVNLIKKANIESGYGHFDNPAIMREYKKYIKLLNESDLPLEFDNGIFVIRRCEICDKEYKVKWSKREQSYCSNECVRESIRSKPNAMKFIGEKRRALQKNRLYELFDKYVWDNKKIPTKGELNGIFNDNGINDFRTAGIYKGYQYILDQICERYKSPEISVRKLNKLEYQLEFAEILIEKGLMYNHKVVSIQKIGIEDVYNGTVDEFHNYGIVVAQGLTKSKRPKLDIAFTLNCGEQSLESFELCCLVETFPSHHESFEEFQETLEYAYLYAKTITLVNTHWDVTNAVMLKNRRIGISQTGIIDAMARHGRHEMINWCKKGYKFLKEIDEKYSNIFCVPKCRKITTVKPSGTVSLLAGVSPGIHYPHSEYYIRRIRISKDSSLVDILKEANYPVEDDSYSQNSIVVEFPVHRKDFARSKKDATMWEQVGNAIDYQHYWSDNQVSITVTFNKEESKDLQQLLEFCEDKLKGLSLLPISEHGYTQAPYEEITKEEYERRVSELGEIKYWTTNEKGKGEMFCDSDHCEPLPYEN